MEERSAKKSGLTKRLSNLQRLAAEGDVEQTTLKFTEIKRKFNEFEKAHEMYHNTLTVDDDIVKSNTYFLDCESNYTKIMSTIRSFIEFRSKPSNSSPQYEPFQSKSILNLPPTPTPDVFNGKPETYPLWRASFNTLVGKHGIGYDEKMFYLKQYTSGEARSAIEALFLCPNEESYKAALQILEDRFGNAAVVTASFRRRLESWTIISDSDSKALQNFSDFLVQISVAKKTYPSLSILDDQFENQKLLKKLPKRLVDQWIEKVVSHSHDSFPNFNTFCDFIKHKAMVANHPLRFSHQPTPNEVSPSKPTVRVQNTELVGQRPNKICVLCDKNHKLDTCPSFQNLNIEDRFNLIRTKNLCFACLKHGHASKDCRGKVPCAVCSSERHHTTLHKCAVVNATEILSTPSSFENRPTTMVVPVRLKGPNSNNDVLTYALLDTQSNTNFISTQVADTLGLVGKDTLLELKTMSGNNKIPTKSLTGLTVESLDGNFKSQIPKCYTRESIPSNKDCIPTQDMIMKWPHLSSIVLPPYLENVSVGLLLGYHTHEVFRPLEVLTGDGDSPFGWKTPPWLVYHGQHPF